MSTQPALPSGQIGQAHSGVPRRRLDQLVPVALAGLIPFLIALGVSVENPNPNFALDLGLIAGALGLVALVSISRLEVTVTILALFLGLLDGPVKLLAANQAASSVRDVVIAAVSVGAIWRLIAKRERISAPPLSGWVAAFVLVILLDAVNPNTNGILKIVGGFRQNLEWVPFFFFGYALIRSKERFRKMFIVLGVIALANGVVSTYQTQMTPGQLASWGPGYAEVVNGSINEETGGGISGRKYKSEGVARVRPPGLGSDSGHGGALGVIALPGTLALLATGGRRRRWYAILLCLGSLLAVVTCLGRLQVVGAGVAVVGFVLLSLSAGKRVTRPLGALLAVGVLALPLGALFVSAEGAGVFSRYESIEPNKVVETSETYKEGSLAQIPTVLAHAPFGFGLGTAGPAASFGGKEHGLLEGHGASAETQYNFFADELGVPGLFWWLAVSVELIVLLVRWLPRIEDVDIRICLAGVFAVFLAHVVMGLRGAFMDTSAYGPFFWFMLGIAAYWLAGPGRRELRRDAGEPATMQASPA